MSKEPSPENAGTFLKTAFERFLADDLQGIQTTPFEKHGHFLAEHSSVNLRKSLKLCRELFLALHTSEFRRVK